METSNIFKSSAKSSQSVQLVIMFSALLCLVIAPFFGSSHFSVRELWGGDSEIAREIFYKIRIPRVLLGFFTGAALGMAGMVFQGVFRNSLATPYTLGVASGASVGAVIAIHFGFTGAFLSVSMIGVSSILGAFLSMAVVYFVAHILSMRRVVTMLLVGVALNFFFSSLILLFQYLNDFTESFQVVRWLMGGLEIVGFDALAIVIPVVLICSICIFLKTPELDLLALGDDLAQSRGVRVEHERLVLFLLVSLMVGIAVAFCGPIGFVGMMVPHICRVLLGVRHTRLAPFVFIVSGAFLVLCDLIARTIIAPAEMPVGVITALLGGPFFLWIVITQRER